MLNKKARTFTIPLVMEPDLEAEFVKARNQLDMKSHELLKSFPARVAKARAMGVENPGDTVSAEDQAALDPLVKARDKAEEALEDVTQYFMFRAVGRKKHRTLVNEHPPTSKQVEDAKVAGEDAPAVNHETYARALVTAALVKPVLTREQVDEMFDSDDWNKSELDLLYTAANAPQVDVGQFSQ